MQWRNCFTCSGEICRSSQSLSNYETCITVYMYKHFANYVHWVKSVVSSEVHVWEHTQQNILTSRRPACDAPHSEIRIQRYRCSIFVLMIFVLYTTYFMATVGLLDDHVDISSPHKAPLKQQDVQSNMPSWHSCTNLQIKPMSVTNPFVSDCSFDIITMPQRSGTRTING